MTYDQEKIDALSALAEGWDANVAILTAEQAEQVVQRWSDVQRELDPNVAYRAPETLHVIEQVLFGIASGRFRIVDGEGDD